MFCPKCGSEVKNNARFCCNCGEQIIQANDKKDLSARRCIRKSMIIIASVVVVIMLVILIFFTKSDNSNKVTANESAPVVSETEEVLANEEIEYFSDSEEKTSSLFVVETEIDREETSVDSGEEKIEQGEYIRGWIEKRHREADSDIGGYDYDYYILVCDVPYILQVETEEGGYEDRFVEILLRCDEGIEKYNKCYIECCLDSAWENLIHGPGTGDRNNHVVVDVSNIKVLAEPAKEETITEEIYDLSTFDRSNADLNGKTCKVYQFLGLEKDSEGREVFSFDLVYENICGAVIADKNGKTYEIDHITDVQLIVDDSKKENLQFVVGSIVGVTGKLYKTTTEGYMYDIYMEVETIE